jgi:hypothetical protein
MPGHVFISYRHGDDDLYVRRLADFLTGEGLPVWYDGEIVTGDRWDEVIREQIDTCAALLVVMTPAAERSSWVAREIDQAELKNKPIFPLLLSGQRFFRLSHLQYEDVANGLMPGGSLVARLRANAGQQAAPVAQTTKQPPRPPSAPVRAERITTISTTREGSPAIAISPDGATLAIAPGGSRLGGGRTVQLYDTATWHLRGTLVQHWSEGLANVNVVAFEPRGIYLTTGGREWRGTLNPTPRPFVQHWFANTGTKAGRNLLGEGGIGGVVVDLAYSTDGRRFAVCFSDSSAVEVRLADRGEVAFSVRHGDTANGAAFSRDNHWLATGSMDRAARICDARTGGLRHLLGHDYTVWGVAFSHDSRLLATASTPAHVWDVHSGAELFRLWPGGDFANRVTRSVAFGPGDTWLAVAGADKTVRIWDPRTGTQLSDLVHEAEVGSVAFGRSGEWLAAGTDDAKVHIWRLRTSRS